MSNLYRKDFPIFDSSENKGLIYFDNAANNIIKKIIRNYLTDIHLKINNI